jgi:aspartate aminotransferase
MMQREFAARRDYAVDFLNRIPGVSCCRPEGAFYVFPRVDSFYGKRAGDRLIDGSLAMCDYLIEQARIAAVPGIGFGADPYIRLSYATSMPKIEEGLKRLEAALAELR